MQFKQILAASIGAACLLIVVFLTLKHSNKPAQSVAQPEIQLRPSTYSWNELLAHVKEEIPLPEVIEKQMQDSAELTLSDTSNLNNSIEICYKNQYFIPAARLQMVKAQITKSPFDFIKAAEAIHTLATMERDTLVRNFMMAEVVELSSEALTKEPSSIKANLYKALALADKKETMMNAVPHLLTVVRADENNIPALYTLGLLSIESGQLDKALQRFEKLVSLQPSIPDYHFQLASVNERLGQLDEARKQYEICRDLTENAEAKEEINKIISNLK